MTTKTTIFFFLLIFISFSCNNSEEKKSDTEETSKIDVVEEIIPVKDTTQTFIPSNQSWDVETIIGEAGIWRKEDVEGSNNWTNVLVYSVIGFTNDVAPGETLQVIPLTNNLPIVGLKVVETKKRAGYDVSDVWYDIKLEEIRNSEYRNFKQPATRRADMPADVLIVYPSVKNCTLLETRTFDTRVLPKGVTSKIIKGALDFDGDGNPDAILCEFCCRKRTPVGECDLICTETFIKTNGEWIMLNSSMPY